MADRDTLAILAGEVGLAVQPLAAALVSPGAFRDFLEDLGWNFETVPEGLNALSGPVSDLVNLVGDGQVDPSEIQPLLDAVLALFRAITNLNVAGDLSAEFKSEFPKQLVEFLLARYLIDNRPSWGFLLMALGVIRFVDVDPTAERQAIQLAECDFSDLGTLLSDPLSYWKSRYKWNTPDFDGVHLAQSVTGLLTSWGVPVRERRRDAPSVAALAASAVSPDDVVDASVEVLLVESSLNPELFAAGVGLFLLPQTATDMPGFVLLPFATADFDAVVDLSDQLTLSFDTQIDLTGNLGIFVRPNRDVQFFSGIDQGAPTPLNGSLKAVLALSEPGDPILLLGQPDGSRFEVGGVSTIAGVRIASDLEPFVEMAIQGGKIVVQPSGSDRDGFLATILPEDGLSISFDLTVGFSTIKGLYLGGASRFEIAVPSHLQLGPVEVQGIKLAARPGDGALPIDVTATMSLDLSVVKATVQDIGFTADLTFPPNRDGNLGPANLALKFKAPDGVGLAIDSGSVHGGGVIVFDQPNGRYFGGLQLSIYDISVSAFGLIETKVPGVSYSFVIIISAQFTPIQLGFGFTLNGVGGMVGINRGIDTTALATLVRAGQSEELLFPKNVISDAPTIVRDLTTVFPATQGQYVFGPLGKLGWGTPTLITGEIGIILEYPALVVVLLGEVKCLLPKPDQALVKLNLSIDGVLDFPNKTFSMDADLHDSVINGFPVSGQMAMRVSWGDNPNFIFSIGGFHPAYTPPPNFPKLQPMTLDLGSHGPAKISVSGFFAVTSNTVQVGGTASLHASGSGITLDASVSVKALFVFQPFSFEADVDASVKISFHGYGPSVHLSGTLDGPSPWHIKGEVCVSIIWWDACLGFDVTFGGDTQITQPSIDPWVGADATDSTPAILGLHDALSDAGNWSAALVPGTVSSVARAQGSDTLIDPVGGLTVRQKTAPVETPNPLTKFGVAKTPQPITFSNVQATLGAAPNPVVPLTAVEPVNEPFAPAQFFDMDDGKKLSSPGFEQYQAGYVFATDANKANVQGGSAFTFMPQLVTWQINSDGSQTQIADFPPTDDQVAAANQRSAVAKSGLTQAGTRRFVNRAFVQAFSEVVPTFVIGDNTTLFQVANSPVATVRSATLIALDALRTQRLEEAAGFQVTAVHEAVKLNNV